MGETMRNLSIYIIVLLLLVCSVVAIEYNVVVNRTSLPKTYQYNTTISGYQDQKIDIIGSTSWLSFRPIMIFDANDTYGLETNLTIPYMNAGNYTAYISYTYNHTNLTKYINYTISINETVQNEFILVNATTLKWNLWKELLPYTEIKTLTIQNVTGDKVYVDCRDFVSCPSTMQVNSTPMSFDIGINVPKTTSPGYYYYYVGVVNDGKINKFDFYFNISEIEKIRTQVNMTDCLFLEDGSVKIRLIQGCLEAFGYNFSNISVSNESRTIYEDTFVPVFKYDFNDSISMYSTVMMMKEYINNEKKVKDEKIAFLESDMQQCNADKNSLKEQLNAKPDADYVRLQYKEEYDNVSQTKCDEYIDNKGLVWKGWFWLSFVFIILIIVYVVMLLISDKLLM